MDVIRPVRMPAEIPDLAPRSQAESVCCIPENILAEFFFDSWAGM